MTAEQGSPTTRAGGSLLTHHAGCAECDCAMPRRVTAIEAEARQQALTDAIAAVEEWLADPMWPRFGPGIGSDPLDAGRMAARAAAQQVIDTLRDGS